MGIAGESDFRTTSGELHIVLVVVIPDFTADMIEAVLPQPGGRRVASAETCFRGSCAIDDVLPRVEAGASGSAKLPFLSHCGERKERSHREDVLRALKNLVQHLRLL